MPFTRPTIVRDDDGHRVEVVEPDGAEPVTRHEWHHAIRDRAREAGMPSGAMFVGLLMSIHGNDGGEDIWPSVQTVIRVSGKSKSSVYDALRWLRENGWLRQVSRGSGGTGQTSEYRLTLPARFASEQSEELPEEQQPDAATEDDDRAVSAWDRSDRDPRPARGRITGRREADDDPPESHPRSYVG